MKLSKIILSSFVLSFALLTSCNGSGLKGFFGGDKEDNDSTKTGTKTEAPKEEAPKFDAALTTKLVDLGDEKKLDSEQLGQLIDQFDFMLKNLDTEIDDIAKMPAGDAKCEAVHQLGKRDNDQLLERVYSCLNHADDQPGFNNEIGSRLKNLDVRKRQKNMRNKIKAIVSECQ